MPTESVFPKKSRCFLRSLSHYQYLEAGGLACSSAAVQPALPFVSDGEARHLHLTGPCPVPMYPIHTTTYLTRMSSAVPSCKSAVGAAAA